MAGDVTTTASAAPLLRDSYSHAEPGEGKPMQHSRAGVVSSIDAHPDGKHATIRVTHGKRKKDPTTGDLVGYHRQDSHVTVPKAAAKSYAIGQRVHAGLSPADDASPAPKAIPKAKGKPAAKKKAAGKRPFSPSPIASAMQGGAPC